MRLPAIALAAALLVPVPARADPGGARRYSHANDFFGQALALDGGRLAVGIAGSNTGGFDAGVVHVYAFEYGQWQLEAVLHNPDEEPARGYFGRAVALAGDTLVVGATIEDGYAPNTDDRRGNVHVFTRRQGAWMVQASLEDSNVDSDSFGRAVALVGDTLAVVNAARIADRELRSTRVHVFARAGESWEERAGVELPEEFTPRWFGLGAGTLVVADRGEVVAFRRRGDGWDSDPSLTIDAASIREFAVEGTTAVLVANGGARVYRDRDGAWSVEAELDLGEVQAVAVGDERIAFKSGEQNGDVEHVRVALWQRRDGAWRQVEELAETMEAAEVWRAGLAVHGGWLAVGYPFAGEPAYEQSGVVVVHADAPGLPEVARLSPEDAFAGCDCRTGGGPAGALVVLLTFGRRGRRRR